MVEVQKGFGQETQPSDQEDDLKLGIIRLNKRGRRGGMRLGLNDLLSSRFRSYSSEPRWGGRRSRQYFLRTSIFDNQ